MAIITGYLASNLISEGFGDTMAEVGKTALTHIKNVPAFVGRHKLATGLVGAGVAGAGLGTLAKRRQDRAQVQKIQGKTSVIKAKKGINEAAFGVSKMASAEKLGKAGSVLRKLALRKSARQAKSAVHAGEEALKNFGVSALTAPGRVAGTVGTAGKVAGAGALGAGALGTGYAVGHGVTSTNPKVEKAKTQLNIAKAQ